MTLDKGLMQQRWSRDVREMLEPLILPSMREDRQSARSIGLQLREDRRDVFPGGRYTDRRYYSGAGGDEDIKDFFRSIIAELTSGFKERWQPERSSLEELYSGF